MFSLQQLFGKGDRFFGLLEAAAQEAHESVRLTVELIKSPRDTHKFDDLVLARRKEKKISDQISTELVKTFVTGLEREDIEALARTIYKIPKTAEKLAERFMLAAPHLQGVEFAEQAEMMIRATDVILAMMKQLHKKMQRLSCAWKLRWLKNHASWPHFAIHMRITIKWIWLA